MNDTAPMSMNSTPVAQSTKSLFPVAIFLPLKFREMLIKSRMALRL